MRVIDIIEGTAVDGPGLRTSIYFAGCNHHCAGCQNPHTWDFDGGREMTVEEIMRIITNADFNVTFSGGDPLFQIQPLIELATRIRALGKTIWCYTGFVYEDIAGIEPFVSLLRNIDVLVDGRFVEELSDISLRFRGSSNQRLIDCRRSTPFHIELWNEC